MFSRRGGGADGAIDGLLEDQRRQFEFQVSYGAFWVGEADQLLGDVDWLLDVPGVVIEVSVWVYPVLPGTQTQSFGVSKVRCEPVDQICKVGGSVCHLDTQVAPEIDVLVE